MQTAVAVQSIGSVFFLSFCSPVFFLFCQVPSRISSRKPISTKCSSHRILLIPSFLSLEAPPPFSTSPRNALHRFHFISIRKFLERFFAILFIPKHEQAIQSFVPWQYEQCFLVDSKMTDSQNDGIVKVVDIILTYPDLCT
jgi:hypothetical protein